MNRGYTLIEIIVVILIISLMSGLSLATYNSFNDSKKMQSDLYNVKSTLELMKKKAMNGDKSLCTGDLQSYTLLLDNATDPSKFTMQANCNTDVTIATYSLSQHQTFTTTDPIVIKPLTGEIEGGDQQIIIKNTLLSKCYRLDISSNGIIDETGPYAC